MLRFFGAVAFAFAMSLACLAQSAQPVTPNFFARIDSQGTGCGDFGPLFVGDINGDGFLDLVCDPVLLGNGNGTFTVGQTLPYDGDPYGYGAMVDVNGDGKLDIVFPEYENTATPDQIGVLLGNGDGTFQKPLISTSSVVDVGPFAVGVGDFNSDGIPDVVELGTSYGLIFSGTGNGSFTAGPGFTVNSNGGYPLSLLVADLNNDGHPDVVALYPLNELVVLLGKGDGTFQPPLDIALPFSQKAWAGSFAIGDVNGDGIPDVAVTNNTFTAILLGKGDGTFESPQWVNLPSSSGSLALADVNGDGILDLVTSEGDVAFGKGNGTFGRSVHWPVAPQLGGSLIAVADLRNDGRNDIITSDTAFNSVLLNTGKGAFQDGIQTTIPGGNVSCAATGDFNGDGVPDIVAVNALGLQIMLGTGKIAKPFEAGAAYNVINPLCPVVGDLNGDGIPDLFVPSGSYGGVGSVTAFLGNGDGTFRLGPISSVPNVQTFVLGDFNGDGKLDYASTSNLLAYGNGDGSFGTPGPYVPNISPQTVGFRDIVVADLSGKGTTDIVLDDYENLLQSQLLYVLFDEGTAGWNQITLAPAPLCIAPWFYLNTGYIDGDRELDLVAATEEGIAVILNKGNGSFTQGACVGSTAIFPGGFPVVADVNGDHISDLLVFAAGYAGVFLGTGGGSFESTTLYFGTGASPVAGYALNMHHQNPKLGKPDLVEVDSTGVIFTLINETK